MADNDEAIRENRLGTHLDEIGRLVKLCVADEAQALDLTTAIITVINRIVHDEIEDMGQMFERAMDKAFKDAQD